MKRAKFWLSDEEASLLAADAILTLSLSCADFSFVCSSFSKTCFLFKSDKDLFSKVGNDEGRLFPFPSLLISDGTWCHKIIIGKSSKLDLVALYVTESRGLFGS